MGLLGKLVLKMSADSADFESNMKKASRSAKKFGKQTKQAAGFAAKATAAAGVAAVAAGAMIVKANLASIDSLAKTADKLGMTTEALAGMRHAAELTGVEQGKLDSSMGKMSKNLGDAQAGLGTAKDYLDSLGLSAQSLAQQKPEEQFAAIADKINGLATQTEKAAAAQAIFGRSGMDLLNTMKLGSEGLAATTAEAITLGLALSRVDAAKVEAANDSMTRMKAASAGFGKTLTVAVAPYIGEIAKKLKEASLKSNGFRDQIATAMEYATKGVVLLGKGFYGLELVWDALKYSFLSMERFLQEGLRQIGEAALSVVEMVNVGGLFDDQIAAGQAILGAQAQIVAQIEADREAVLADGAQTLTQYDELEAKVRKYKAAIDEAAQSAAENVAANAPGSATVTAPGADSTSEADAEKYAAKLAALDNYLADEQNRLFNASVARAEMVTNAFDAGQITEQTRNELLEQIATDHETKMTAIAAKGHAERNKYVAMSGEQQVKSTADSAITLLSVAGKYNKKAEKVARAAAMVRATIAMWQGVAEGVKLGYPAAIPAVAAALATGALALSNIGGGGGASPSTAMTANGDTALVTTTDPLANQATPQQSVTVIVENMVGTQEYVDNAVIPAINDAISRAITLDTAAA